MNDERNPATGKKPWPTPKIIDVGRADEQTTAGTGNLGDQIGTDRWQPTAISTDEKAILPEGE